MSDRERPKRRRRPRRLRLTVMLICGVVVVGLVVAKPILHVVTTISRDVDQRSPLPPGLIDDASRMNRTPVAEVWPIPNEF